DTESILSFAITNNVLELDGILGDIAARHEATKGVLLLRARDSEGRNAVHYAAIGHANDTLEYLLDPELFPGQPHLHLALFYLKNNNGENTALYAIRQRCPPAFLDRILTLTGRDLLRETNNDGLGPLHCAAAYDAGELLRHLVAHHHLDPNGRLGTSPRASPLQSSVFLPEEGDTPLHLAARYNAASAFEALYGDLRADSLVRNRAGDTPFHVAAKVDAKAVL
ncbi:uncharacterized protein THITE_25922, partial [Thermothielavioides terrestris NRRL 8126]